jgi:hypothetical protein
MTALPDSTATLADTLDAAIGAVRERARRRSDRSRASDQAADRLFDWHYEQIRTAIQGAAGRTGGAGPAMPETGRAAIAETVAYLREIGERAGDGDHLLDVLGAVAEISATMLVSRGDFGRRDAALAEIGPDTDVRDRLTRTLLCGPPPAADVRHQIAVYGIDHDQSYVAFRAKPTSRHERDELARLLLDAGSGAGGGAVVVHLDGDLVGFLAEPPTGGCTGVVGIGPPRTPERLAESFHLASRAADCASAFGLSGVHSLDTLGLLPAVQADSDVGESLLRRYVRPATGIESLPELLNTIGTYLACGRHVHRTASTLFLHPNTLRYRITRFEKLTGARLRDPVSAMEVWWALHYHRLSEGRQVRRQ